MSVTPWNPCVSTLHVDLHQGVKSNWSRLFPAHGHGTIIFNLVRCTPFSIVVTPVCEQVKKWIALEVYADLVQLVMYDGQGMAAVCRALGDNVGFEPQHEVSYWMSYDRDNLVIKYGKGYRMEETTILKHDFLVGLTKDEQKLKRDDLVDYFNPVTQKHIDVYDLKTNDAQALVMGESVSLRRPIKKQSEGHVDFDFHPFISNLPPVVLDSSRATLMDVDNGNKMLSASLPKACQELYQNVVHLNLNWLESVDGCKLSDAIRYSIITKGCLLYSTLEEKANTFGKSQPKNTYLRVTLGPCRGDSPGVPYVLEIWPTGHYSPIHSHSNAYAIIKVIHGSITVNIYNKHVLSEAPDNHVVNKRELMTFTAESGDVTWISPHWYQTHKLWNQSNDFCATIQAYKYADEDKVHWPYFNYVREVTGIGDFLPQSDMTFREMHDRVLHEYKTRPRDNKK